MDLLKQKLNEIFKASGLDFSFEVDEGMKKVSVFIHDEGIVRKFFPKLVFELEHIIKVIAKNLKIEKVIVDVNNYKREREGLIVELAKAAARKVLVEQKEIALPAMNAYERRLAHMILSEIEGIETASEGVEPYRRIVVRKIK